MDKVPLEVLIRHSAHEVGKFFAEKVENERRNGKVAVLVEDFTHSLYFIHCDNEGYPNEYMFNYMTFDSLSLATIAKGSMPTTTSMSVEQVSIYLEKPLILNRYDWREKPIVFLWSGRKMSTSKIPLEKLNVSELMKIAQQVIQNREGLVIDEAIKNKIYK